MKTKKNRTKKINTEPEQIERVPQLLSRRQVAKMSSLCTETIKRMQARGQLTPIKLSPRCVRYDRDEVLKVFADARVAA